MSQMTPPWVPLLRRCISLLEAPFSKKAQIATVTNGEPRCRTVGIFKVLDNGDIYLNTDTRSEKVRRDPNLAELCWFFPGNRRQFRLRGQLTVVAPRTEGDGGPKIWENEVSIPDSVLKERLDVWRDLPDYVRQCFTGLQPGVPITTEKIPAVSIDVNSPPDNYALVILKPNFCDYLVVTGPTNDPNDDGKAITKQKRIVYEKSNNSWTTTEVVP
eukprot:157430_1